MVRVQNWFSHEQVNCWSCKSSFGVAGPSRGERLAEECGHNGLIAEREVSFLGCCGRRDRAMPFDDAYYVTAGTALMEVAMVEYDGEQHYRPIELFGGKKAFLRQVRQDQKKNSYCEGHSHLLIRVPYTAKTEEDAEEVIRMFLSELRWLKLG